MAQCGDERGFHHQISEMEGRILIKYEALGICRREQTSHGFYTYEAHHGASLLVSRCIQQA